ncbi:DUF2207 domain-containing protein [Nocardioides marmoriginsengisoli]|uniref:DUF2207 domain-containing protein n=1 Tax=Nocardioides marmoriginsengisoli TaxID=661483 RepID=A0A3N0CPM1_9ACTN|nr:DUF2207 domain-containing protein [Nocardioides marmoriginsengisoli]RNL65417.1 DUF2207 domain-containing protein [Nocardioides marmoriginsengisoli]
MKQLLARVLAMLVLAAVVAIGGISFSAVSSPSAPSESATITKYESDYDVKANGDVDIVERLTVDLPCCDRHGIFRLFDTRDPNVEKNRLIPKDITVTRDGRDEPFDVQSNERGRFRNVKIGSGDTTIQGEHVYRISYRIKGALTPGHDGSPTQFYWNLIGAGWVMPIKESDLTVHLPAPGTNLRCAEGAGSGAGSCTAEGDGTETIRVKTGPLAPNTPVTIKTDLDLATPDGDTRPWASKLDPILGQHPVLLGFVVVLAGLLGVAGAALSLQTREKQPPYPLMYAPPEGIGPAQAAYLMTEKVENKAFVATMMYAAEQGAVTLAQDGKSWTLTGTDKTDTWSRIDSVTQLAGTSLGVASPGAAFTASPSSVSSGQKLKTALSAFDANTKGWAKTSGLMENVGLGGFGGFFLLLLLGATVYLGAFNPFDMSIIAIVPGIFLITAISVGATGAGTRRTAAGRDLWSRVGGFYRTLSTPSAQDRFDFSGRKELYTSYLPWAVAFDCADEWAKKYRIETGEEPPAPNYFPTYTGVHAATFVNQMVDSFDSTVSSAISAYNATQSSSSSGGGGGGFSGGGGGGGGGGGSW